MTEDRAIAVPLGMISLGIYSMSSDAIKSAAITTRALLSAATATPQPSIDSNQV